MPISPNQPNTSDVPQCPTEWDNLLDPKETASSSPAPNESAPNEYAPNENNLSGGGLSDPGFGGDF